MNEPIMLSPRTVNPDTDVLGAYLPVPGAGILPVNAYVIRAPQPVLVDTGLAALREDFLKALRACLDPAELRWIWLTHVDADHIGNLAAVLELAPRARLVTSFLGMGKLNMHGLPVDRVFLLNPGQTLQVGNRALLAVTPPSFDAPETTGLYDPLRGTLFSADSFGALMSEPADTAGDIPPAALREGMPAWAQVDAPWLGLTDAGRFRQTLESLRQLRPELVLGSHLPPAYGLREVLLTNLAAAREAPAFVGPDQAALEAMMAGLHAA